MTVGNRQGDPLSPRSFALFLEKIMDTIRNRENSGVSVHGNRVNNLRFADDIDIIEQRNEKLQDTVNKLHIESGRYRMHGPHFWDQRGTGSTGGRSNENDLCFYSSLYSVLYK